VRKVSFLRDVMIQNWSKQLRMNGISNILQKMYFEIKKQKGRGISKLYIQYFNIGRRTMYGWLGGKSPISIFLFLKFVNLWKNFCKKSNNEENAIIGLAFTCCTYFSIAKGKKVKLPIRMTTDLAYLIGYIIGDGCLSGNNLIKRSQFRIRIASDTKQFLKQTINPLFTELFSIKGSIYKIRNSKCYEYSVQSKVLYLFFNKILIQTTTTTQITIPAEITTTTTEIIQPIPSAYANLIIFLTIGIYHY